MADNKMEKSIKEAIGKSLNEFNKRIGMAKLIKDNKNQDRILKGILSQVNDENIEKTEKSNVITLDNSTDGIVELQEIKGDTNVNVSKMEKEIPITHVIDDKNGNVISLDGITEGAINIDDIQGNTMVNCNKDTDKELILMPNLETNGYSNITLTEGIDGGKVDVSLEGNTMVNVCDQEESIAITKSYTVETGNYIALQGEYDGKCRPNVYGNTLVNLAGNSNLWEVGCSGDKNTDYTITSTDAQGIVINKLTDNIDYLYFRKRIDPSLFKPNTTYTIIFNCSKAYRVGVISGNTAETILPLSPCNDGYNAITLASTDLSTITGKNVIYAYLGVNKSYIGIAKASDFILLEGDYTNKPIPDYFTGMKSSFEDKLVPIPLISGDWGIYGGSTYTREDIDNGISATLTSAGSIVVTKKYNVDGNVLKDNTTYTFVFDVNTNLPYLFYSFSNGTVFTIDTGTPDRTDYSNGYTRVVVKKTTTTNCTNIVIGYHATNTTIGQYINVKNLFVLEGDYTNYDFTDYDSTKVGKYKVDYKVTGKNKCPIENKTITIKGNTTQIGSNDGSVLYKNIDISNLKGQYYFSGKYTINNNTCDTRLLLSKKPLTKSVHNDCYLEATNSGGVELGVGIVDLTNYKYATITTGNLITDLTVNTDYQCILKDIQLEEGTTATTYEPYKESIKTLYLNSPLLEGDTIEQSGNNIIHNHRYKEVVLDGMENNLRANGEDELTNTYRFILTDINNLKLNQNPICDKYVSTIYNSKNDYECIMIGGSRDIHFRISKNKLTDFSINAFRKYLQSNPITVVYELATPTQEIISSNNNLLLDSYTNGHLDVNTVVPIDKVEFKSYGKFLKYLYPSTEYTIQFESDNNGILNALALNDYNTLANLNIVKGINKFTISTSDTIKSNYLYIDGIGFNASKIVVTPKVDNDFGYFKGMKSVGECEGNKIEILSRNKNLFDSNNITKNKYITGQVGTHQYGDYGDSIYTNVSDYMPVKQGKVYIFSYEYETLSNVGERAYCYYDNNKNIIIPKIDTIYDVSKKSTTYTPQQDGYIKIAYDKNCTNIQFEQSDVKTSYSSYAINKKEILLTEPLRGLPNGVKDKYVIIDGKWYIERNCGSVTLDGSEYWGLAMDTSLTSVFYTRKIAGVNLSTTNKNLATPVLSLQFPYANIDIGQSKGDTEGIYTAFDGNLCISITKAKLSTNDSSGLKSWLQSNPVKAIYQLAQPSYEPIDYNPFEVYTDTTHISNNSTIPCNMVIKNTGFNCILKPNTKYTVSSNNGLSTVTTKDSIGDSVLRFYNKDTSKITKMNKVLVLEGDYVTGNPPIPAFFEGMESAFEQELVTDENDEHYGKYKVNVKAVGKNVFDGKLEIGTINIGNGQNVVYNTEIRSTNYTSIKPNTQYTFSCNPNNYYAFRWYDKNKNYLGELTAVTMTNGKIFTTPLNAHYLRFKSISTDTTVKIQIEQGIKATEYEPYKENNITFYINEPLRGVGDIKDKVYVKEDKVVVERNCGSVTFDGSSDEYIDIMHEAVKNKTTEFRCGRLNKEHKSINIICNKFINNKSLWSATTEGFFGFENAKYFIDFRISNNKLLSVDIKGFRQYLQNNPTTVVYQLATPTYEEVEYSNNRLTLNTYNNSTLFYNSNIPISNTSFKPLWEELIYIKNSTTYYIQFNAVGNGNVVVNLGGTELTTTITEGYNKIEITTPNNSTNLLTIDGQGIKISKVVVSEALCSGYYKGLQSCFEEHMENGKYVCVIRGISLDGNKVNGIKFYLNEPLRGIGDIKDRLCIKDGKLMVERKFSSFTFDGSEDENWSSTGFGGHATRNTFEIALANTNGYIRLTPGISSSFNNELIEGLPVNDNAFRIVTEVNGDSYFLFTPSTDIIPYRDINKWKKYLQQNPVKVVYQLATPIYEEVTNEYGLPIILEGYENGIVYVDSSVTPTTSIKYTSNNKVPATLSNVDNLNTTTQNDINNNIVTYMMDIDMMLTEMEMDDSASSVMSLSDSDDNNQNHDSSHSNILDRMNKEDRIKYQDNTTKMLEKVIKGKSLTKEENINRIDLYLSEGKIRNEQSNYLKELLKGVE